MKSAETKAQRLLQIEALLLDHPEGLSQSDIARRLDVHRSTIHRYLPDLTQHAPIFEEDGRLFIDRKAYLVNLSLNLYEALSLHLATRLLTNRLERHNPHNASLLRKLSKTIAKLSPQISNHLSISADVADDPARYKDPHYISVLETLALAWAEGRVVEIWHRHPESEKVSHYRFSVYFIEPYAVGYAVHAIGFREPPGKLRTFNIARIERIEITKDQYRIPEDFDPAQLLQQAWGIWYTTKEPELVELRFSSKVAQRVLETRWHPSQQTKLESDGSLTWTASIAEPKEMLPWIRGWGSDCEVVSPLSLLSKMINEVSNLGRIYLNPRIEPHMELWAKFSRNDETDWHPLLWHLIDTAAVTQVLWNDCLSNSIKKFLASSFNLSIDAMGQLIAFWVGLHDIGKAGPEFQKKNTIRQHVLEDLGFVFPTSRFSIDGFHATATTLILRRAFSSAIYNYPARFRMDLAITLGGHHGEFPEHQLLNKGLIEKHHVGDGKWQEMQDQLIAELANLLDMPCPTAFPDNNSSKNPLFIIIAGLATSADWIASNEIFFPFLVADLSTEEYFSTALKQARNALNTLGWYGWKSNREVASFKELFPEFTPNEIQQSIIDLLPDIQSPFLAIIEAPTGSGKTEAALYLADAINQQDEKSGIYIAMPTQATSNQMFSRTANFLAHRYSENEINLHLVHGAALLNNTSQDFEPTSVWGEDSPDFSNIHAHRWFLPRKRTLLAPFGVGTVDQTFLSVLKSRHFFLRLFGLSHKVLVFDEVHAYDIYMTEIFKVLLGWLNGVGTSVIILSATLPENTRNELINAFGAKNSEITKRDFPRISLVSNGKVQFINTGNVESRKIQLEWIDKEPDSILRTLDKKLASGGCAAVICNRVNRAQEVYNTLITEDQDEETEIILFHSRFPYSWRKEIEDRVLEKFGKDRKHRPFRAIVVATQVIEQSLDLDFDFLITDLSPIDLLIQRIGRLHRHSNSYNDRSRPMGLKTPQCVISAPGWSDNEEIPNLDADRFIYEPYVLLRTLYSIQERESLLLPEETDSLIEQVYSLEKSPSMDDILWEKLQVQKTIMLKNQARSTQNANNYLIPSKETTILGNLNSPYSDDIQGISKKIVRTPTREISPTVQIVCLIEENDELHILGSSLIIDLTQPSLSPEQTRACLKASVALNNWDVINYFLDKATPPPDSFRKNSALHWQFPVIFSNGKFTTEKFTLILDREKGIQIKTER